jgi:mannan endo-1,4-beta-mannosidase
MAAAGRPPAVVHFFQGVAPRFSPPQNAVAAAREVDAIPMLTWVPRQGMEPINRGEHDDDLRAYAVAVREMDEPILLRPAQEMNLPAMESFGPPDRFVAAWRRIRGIFDEVGVPNAIWVWCPYVLDRGVARFEAYYPGHDLVDVVALDGYNWGRRRWWQRWRSFDAVFRTSYAALRQLAAGKPIVLPEVGSAETGGDKAAWMREALLEAIPARYPAIEAVIWFDHHRPDHPDWRIASSPAALAAWREVVADPRYQMSGAQLVDRLGRTRR